MKRPLVIGSRGSKLALWQAEHTKAQLLLSDPELSIHIEIIKTTGDVDRNPLTVIGGKGVFTKELEEALIDGRIDLAVHSLKDLPTILPDKLMIAAICEREDVRDALILRDSSPINSLSDIQSGALVGTSSQRRMAQLKYKRPDVITKDIRGNVDTRIRKLDAGDYDALVLASAGLRRLALEGRINLSISTEDMLPAVGQGAIAIETHVENDSAIQAARKLADDRTSAACLAERAFLRSLGGGCQLPIAGHAVVREQYMQIDGLVASPDGSKVIRNSIAGSLEAPEQLGEKLAMSLRELGAEALLQDTVR